MATYDAPFTISYQGQSNLADSTLALFKDRYVPELLAFRDSKCVMDDKVQRKSLTSGKSTTFPLLGRTTTSHHTPGDLIAGNAIAQAETKIEIDYPLIASVFVTEEDKAFNEMLLDGAYTQRLGSAMGKTEDQYRIRQACLAARASNDLTSEVGGSVINNVDDTTGEGIYEAIKAGVQVFREKDVDEDIFCLLDWARWNILFEYLPLINSDYKGQGNIAEGTLTKVAGANLLCSNNVEYGTAITGTHQDRYNVDMTDTAALMFTRDAVAQADLMAYDLVIVPKPENMGTLMYTKQMYGVGKHDPRCALELSTTVV